MKTPREILLAKHQAAETKLDQIRLEAITQLCRSRDSEIPTPKVSELTDVRASLPRLLRNGVGKLWRELVWPSRHIWGGLAAVWVALIIINVAGSDPSDSRSNSVEVSS